VIIDFHGERAGGRAIGRPRTAAAANPRDPATAALLAKQLIQSGAWRTVPQQGDDTAKAWYYLRVHAPAALSVLPRVVVAALTKQPPSPGCHWCSVVVQTRLSFGAEREPAPDELLLKVLGNPCSRCRVRHAMAAAAADQRQHIDQVVAAGLRPQAAGRLRSPAQVRRHAAAVERLRQDPPPMQATGFIWVGGKEPPASIAHKVPPPSY
jgi:hypothetical protein